MPVDHMADGFLGDDPSRLPRLKLPGRLNKKPELLGRKMQKRILIMVAMHNALEKSPMIHIQSGPKVGYPRVTRSSEGNWI